ncbi:hypothetical protein BH11VER1_BH11VER1_30910 [soil metagenome]
MNGIFLSEARNYGESEVSLKDQRREEAMLKRYGHDGGRVIPHTKRRTNGEGYKRN